MPTSDNDHVVADHNPTHQRGCDLGGRLAYASVYESYKVRLNQVLSSREQADEYESDTTSVLCLRHGGVRDVVFRLLPEHRTRRQPRQQTAQFNRWDINSDGKVTRDELPEVLRGNFNRVDTDKDGSISLAEHVAFLNRGRTNNRRQNGQRQGGRRLPEGVAVTRNLEYVENGHERHRLDLYLPEDHDPTSGETLPVVVWIHGGAWRAGSKENCPAIPLVTEGFAVASINYRLSSHATFPAQIHDCKAAVRWLRANAHKYGLNKERFGAWGSSAGGHLVALLGTTGNVDSLEGDLGHNSESSRIQAVCDWYGPTDFLQMNIQAGEIGRMNHDADNSPESMLVGGAIQDNPDKVRRANPITYVSKDDPPFWIVHGDSDPLVPLGQSHLLEAALRDADVVVTLNVVKDGQHGGFRDPKINKASHAFFVRQLKRGTARKREQTESR